MLRLFCCLFALTLLTQCVEPPAEIQYIARVQGRTVETVVGNRVELPTQLNGDSVTTFILVRHAEKGTGEDPFLTNDGRMRAHKLAVILADMPIDLVFTSPYNRTISTIQPLVMQRELEYAGYDTDKLEQLVSAVFSQVTNRTVLISGHSNTTPALLNQLVGSEVYDPISEDDYENIYFVIASEPGKAKVFHFKY